MSTPDYEGIAIIGLAGRFPGAADVAAFWRNLVAGAESISTFSDEELAAAGVDVAAVKNDPAYVRARGIIEDAEFFDAAFFGMQPREAEVTDPQQRVFLETAWTALENAGYAAGTRRATTGVFAGMRFNTYYLSNLHDRRDLLALVGPDVAMLGNEKDYLATRVAYKLNLAGPAINVSTACSTSLVAVGLACQSLLNYQCDMALAGGASVTFPQKRGSRFQEGAITSPDGHTRTFDARAQGTVFSDGVGVVVLKRLADAVADGDQICAVIKAVGLNNDGAAKVSFAAPSVDGHAEVIALAHALAGVEPESITYVEAHGTATPLGDPIEVAGLTQAFRAGTAAKNFCALGSVKTNIGHLDAAAGVAGLIKTALALQNRVLPPTLHYTQPNPQIDFASSPFYVNTALAEWKPGATPRRAGVSSFGTGGTNAHAVLEEAPMLESSGASRPQQLLVLSAKTATALAAATANLAAHFTAHPDTNLADAAFTLQTGRTAFSHRRMLVCADAADAAAALRSGDAKRLVTRRADGTAAEVVFLFPGQGAQTVGMGCELYEREPVFRAEVDRCAEILRPVLEADLRDVLRGPEERLNQTRFAQPALFVVEYALAKLWMSWGITPAAMLGHSVGEYVAACLAGVFSLEDALHLVAARAALVQAQPPGAMLAVRLAEAELTPLLGDGLALAAVNSPRLCVASGTFVAVEKLETVLHARGIAARRLATSHAFHSAMMEPVLAPFTALLEKVTFHAPQIPYISNVTGQWITAAEATDPKYWTAHLRQTVRFSAGVAELLRNPRRALLEVGPGSTLSTLARQQATAAQAVVASLPEGGEQAAVLGALGRLWLAGIEIDWAKFYAGERRHRVALPAYPFERKRYWVEPAAKTISASAPLVPAPEPTAVPSAPAPAKRPAELAELFRELSGVADELPGNVTFLELGFDSLVLTQASLAVQRKFGVRVTFRQLLEDLSTLDALAAFIEARAPQAATARESAPTLAREPATPAAPAAHGPFKPIQKELGAALTERQQAHLDALIFRYEKCTVGSKRLTREHRSHLADPRTVAGFRHAWKEITYPIVAARSAGSRIWDVDGNEYVDFVMGFGANFFGHSPEFVTRAVEKQLRLGVEIGPQSPLAGEVARMVCELTGAERAAFCSTGSEAVMAALRIARTVSGRDKIVTFSGDYHGVFDEVLVRPALIDGQPGAAPIAPGIPPSALGNVVVLDYGDPRSLETLRALAPELAAVLVEPVQSRRLDWQPREFLHEVRAITAASGTALIFDEIVTGFRMHLGGMQALFEIKADLATYGKVIGSGFPIGVVAGRREYLDALDGGAWDYGDDSFPETGVTFFAGTFVRHPVALAAAHAVLTHLKNAGPALQSGMNERGAQLAATLTAIATELRAPLRILQFGSMLFVQFLPEMKFGALLFFHLREKGIHAWDNRTFVLTTAHTDADLDRLATAFRESLAELRAADFFPALTAPVRTATRFPLTEPQRELWLAARMSADASRAFNDTFAIDLRGPLDVAALEAALAEIVNRHDALRSTFDAEGAGQNIAPGGTFTLPLVELSESVETLTAREHGRAFDLAHGPVFRAQLIRSAAEHHTLMLASHHLAVDGWSVGVIFHELKEIYAAKRRGEPCALGPALQYGDYAAWLAGPEHAASAAAAEKYWLEKFASPPQPVELPVSGVRPAEKTYRAGCARLVFDAEFSRTLRQAAAREGCTLLAYLLAGFKVWLHRLSRQRDIVVGVPAAGQLDAAALSGSGALIGHCVHLLPVRTECCGEETFSALLATVKRNLLEASEHQAFTLGSLIEKLQLVRDASRTPLVSATFNIDRAQSGFALPDLQTEIVAAAKAFNFFDLGVNIVEAGAELRVDCNYNADLFDAATVTSWLGHYRTLLAAAMAAPTESIARLPLLSAGEQTALLGAATASFAPERCIHELFEAHAKTLPEAVALTFEKQHVTYGELNARANRLAHHLRALGVGPEVLVAICLERSTDLLTAILAVLKAGGAYVPLDPDSPGERLGLILADAQTPVVLTQERLLVKVSGTNAAAFCLDRDAASLAALSAENPAPLAGPNSAAYVIYTSGSTGVPKGVVITHHQVVRLFQATDAWFHFGAGDVWTLFHSPAFDFSVWEIWGALAHGGRLVVVPYLVSREPAQFYALLAEEKVTVLNQTPLAFQQLIRVEDDATARRALALRYVIFGGEALDFPALRPWFERHGDTQPQLVNMYGITETTVHVTYRPVTRADLDAATGSRIGVAIPDLELFVLDAALAPCPVGVPGELYVGGAGVARGYLRRPELTAERFIPHPWKAGTQLYKSGDLARHTADGDLEYLGRADMQVKVRGFRIELGEIEAALLRHPGVAQCAVLLRALPNGESGLAAYFVRANSAAPTARELHSFLQGRLPAYMIPSAFTPLTALPLNHNGKLDAGALPPPGTEMDSARNEEGIAPRTPLETEVARLWAELLGRNSFSIHDDFFAVGGHSLLAIQLLARLREQFRVEVPVRRLFDTPTIAGVAEFIAAHLPPPPPAKEPCSLISVQRGEPGKRPLFLLPGGWGAEIEFLVYAQLKLHLGADLPIYGMKARGADGVQPPHGSVEEMVVDYVDEIRTVQPHGPYILAGECIGGVLAYEMARRLHALGEEVGLLALLDTERPHRGALRQFLAEERRGQWRRLWDIRIRQPWNDHVANLAQLGLGGKLHYLWKRAARQRAWGGENGAPATLLDARKALAHYPRLLMPHRLGPYRGRVTLLIDEESRAALGNLGWDEVETGGLEIHVLPGNHLSYIRENAPAAAAKLRELIDRTTAQTPA